MVRIKTRIRYFLNTAKQIFITNSKDYKLEYKNIRTLRIHKGIYRAWIFQPIFYKKVRNNITINCTVWFCLFVCRCTHYYAPYSHILSKYYTVVYSVYTAVCIFSTLCVLHGVYIPCQKKIVTQVRIRTFNLSVYTFVIQHNLIG